MPKAGKVSLESLDIPKDIISRLKDVAPGAFEEGKIDFEKLKSLLGPNVDSREEKYSFTWAGRKDALLSLQSTSKGTLVPDQKESINFDTTENVFIEGDNLEVLKLLQKSYFGKIKMIYIDPPYNTGKDFIYKDDFRSGIKSYLQQTGQANGDSVKLTTNPETNGRFHSDWLTMIYPRLFLARNLLADEGIIFVSIDDTEVQNLRLIMNEIFGEENFVGTLLWRNKAGGGGKQGKNNPDVQKTKAEAFVIDHEYLLVYTKNKEKLDRFNVQLSEAEVGDYKNPDNDPRGPYKLEDLERAIPTPISTMYYPLADPDGVEIRPKGGRLQWRYSKERAIKAFDEGTMIWTKIKCDKKVDNRGYYYRPKTKQYLYLNGEERTKSARSILFDIGYTRDGAIELRELFGAKKGELDIFSNPKPTKLIRHLVKICTKSNDIILDFFAGSGTTAHAVLAQNKDDNYDRKFILVQLPELTDKKSEAYKAGFKNITDIAKERIRRVIKKLENESAQQKLGKKQQLDLGFRVFKLSKSNFKIWENFEGKDASELKKQLSLFKNALISGAKNTDVIYECAIKEGFNLNTKIEKVPCNGQSVYLASDDSSKFYICLDERIKSNLVDELKLSKETQLFCLDDALSDSQKMNLSLQCRLKTI